MENINNVASFNDNLRMASIHDFSSNPGNSGGSSGTGGSGGNNGGGTGGAPGGIGIAITPQGSQHAVEEGDLDMLIDYNELAKKGKFQEAFFRDDQIEQTLSVLSKKKKPNALLTGQAGVGKTQIVEELARRLVNNDPVVNGRLKGYTIYELPLGKIVSGSSYVGQLEEKLYSVIEFAENRKNKAILFIDEIHQITGGSNTNPTYDKITQILKPALGRGALRVIGATTTQEAVTFLSDPAFSRRWSEVQVPELSTEQTGEIIGNILADFQKHHEVILPETLIHQLVLIGDEYKQYGSHRPDTAITLLDKAMADARIKRLKLIEKAKVEPSLQYIIQAQPRPILNSAAIKQSALTLLTGDGKLYEQNATALEEVLEKKIIGQTDAKTAVIDAVKRLGLGLTKRTRPVSFLFAGPSGTGKTEIAKQIASSVFGAEDRMVYINMSEYSNPTSLTRIIGSSAGYLGSDSKRELPFDILENNPYQLVLLDEFEKAHTDVQRFFMQALDEGKVKTNRGKEIDFTRTIMVATTNAGVIELGKRSVGFNESGPVKHTTSDIIRMLQGSFDTELINRFEKLIAFTPIDEAEYIKILAVKYNKMIEEAQANRQDLQLTPSEIAIEVAGSNDTLIRLAEETYTPASNGRPAERTIREHIENTILDDLNATQFTFL